MTEAQKKQKQLQKVSEGLNTFKQVADKLRSLSATYDQWIDEAAENGLDDYYEQLIAEKVEVQETVMDLDVVYRQILQQATLAVVFSELKTLPSAMKACKGLLSSSPDFKKLGKSMKSFRGYLDKVRLNLHDMRREMMDSAKANLNPALANIVGDVATDPKHQQRIEAERRASEARIAAKYVSGSHAVSISTDPATAEEAASAGAATDVDAIIAAIDEEKKKG